MTITFFRLHSSYIERNNMWMQYVQTMPMITVAMEPSRYPEWWNAFGIAKIPVPRDPFNRWINVSELLEKIRRINNQSDRTGSSNELLTWSDAQPLYADMDHIHPFRCHFVFSASRPVLWRICQSELWMKIQLNRYIFIIQTYELGRYLFQKLC